MSNDKWWMDTHGNVIARENKNGDVIIDKEYVDSLRGSSSSNTSSNSSSSETGGYIMPVSAQIIGALLGIFAAIGFVVVVFWFLHKIFAPFFEDHKIIKYVIEMVGYFINGQIR